MRRAVHINARRSGTVEGIRYLRQTAAEGQVFGHLRRNFYLVAGGAARPLKFKATIVRDVNLFVGMINDEVISADRKAPDIVCGTDLIEIRSCDLRRILLLNHSARVLA